MVPTDDEQHELVVMYYERQVDGEKTPADYEMEDGDQLRLVPASNRTKFVTVNLLNLEGVKGEHTLRRTDKLHAGFDGFVVNDGAFKSGGGCVFIYQGRRVQGSHTPDDLELEDGSTIHVKVKKDNGKTPATKPAGELYIKLKVQDTHGRSVSLTMRRTGQLQVLIDFYYARAGDRVPRGTGRFLYDGRRLRGSQTGRRVRGRGPAASGGGARTRRPHAASDGGAGCCGQREHDRSVFGGGAGTAAGGSAATSGVGAGRCVQRVRRHSANQHSVEAQGVAAGGRAAAGRHWVKKGRKHEEEE
uniref:Ubiquitin-like domain-containing protein n=1 Tax=Leersia perrieri TaxID=77586 RepID=A0A0D9X0N7_9ORYZ